MSVLDVTRGRSAFTDALRPPPGYVLGACIGTTYSLDFELFTAVLLAFVGSDVEEPLNNPAAVLTSVARLRSQLRVYVNGGSLHPPTTNNRLFALYDRILRPMTMEGGEFHPKVWALRFDPVVRPERHRAEPVYRLLTASRNVTDSGCWELGALFEGTRRAGTQKFGSDVSAFCRKVAASRDLPKVLWRLIEELKSVEFAAPREAADGLRFDCQWSGDRVLINRLPRAMSRALLISPFVRTDFLKRVCDRTDELHARQHARRARLPIRRDSRPPSRCTGLRRLQLMPTRTCRRWNFMPSCSRGNPRESPKPSLARPTPPALAGAVVRM